MVWIKRNLLVVVSCLVGVILIGFGTYLVLGGLARNKQLSEDVEATKTRASQLYDANPFPSQTNIAMAKRETDSLRASITRAQSHLAGVPVDKLDAKQFMVWRDKLLYELRDGAKRAGTELPAVDYSFSFATQRGKNQFSPDTLPHVPEQMAEVKALCMMLFDARVNRIGNIRRARVSADDKSSSFGSDYTTAGLLELVTDSTGQMISNPYELTFFSFSEEVADVLNRLHRSPHGYLVKAVQVEPEDGKMADAGGSGSGGVNPPPPPPPRPLQQRFNTTNKVVVPVPASKPTANDRPVHLLKEKRLKVTMLVYALRPAKER